MKLTPDIRNRVSRRAAVFGLAAATLASPVLAQQFSLRKIVKTVQTAVAEKPQAKPELEKIAAGKQSLLPLGYSADFVPIRTLLKGGQFDGAMSNFSPATVSQNADSSTDQDTGAITRDPFLANVEMGLIAFEHGQADSAVTHFLQAEDNARRRSKDGLVDKAGGFAKKIAGKVTGREDIADYDPLDHEEVLQLNYLALAHLIQGERACYNVARRCMDRQAELKTKFATEIEESKSKLTQQTGSNSKVSDSDRAAIDGLAKEFNSYDSTAARVPNAYVNPLGDYLAGVIQEIASKEQLPLRDNSRIAYENAGRLCGGSSQMTAAAVAMARARVPAGERVLHVIVGEGFAPTRDVMTFGLAVSDQVLPIRIPIFTPVASRVQTVAVYAGDKKLASLDPIGDFEAIRLRDQKDRIPQTMLGVVSSGVMSYMVGQRTQKMGEIGNAIDSLREANASPDTRSWLSLPRRFHVARLVLPSTAKSIRLTSLAADGRPLATTTVPILASENQSVVYARAIDDRIQIQGTRRLWIDGRVGEEQS